MNRLNSTRRSGFSPVIHFTKPMNGSGPSPAMGLCWRYERPDVLLHGFLGLSLVEGEIVKGFDVGLVLVRAGHGSLLQLLKWSTTEERTSEEYPRLPNSARSSSMKFQWPCSNRKLVGHRRSKPASTAGRRYPPSRRAM